MAEHKVLSEGLSIFSKVVGWSYFAAWSLSFYPQVFLNWWTKSVVGLSFDFLMLNIIGHSSYMVFNSVLFWNPELEQQYRIYHGKADVQINDVVFSIHAVTLTAITIFQTLIYERGGQTLSVLARSIALTIMLSICVAVFLALGHRIMWVDFLKYLGIVKLTITTIKYVPQAFINWKRKLTVGWSIGNILLDFSGGVLSIFQMVIDGINTGDWSPFYGDFVKTGLGFLSIGFDIVFIVQHYILYRKNNQKYYAELKKQPSVWADVWATLSTKFKFLRFRRKDAYSVLEEEVHPESKTVDESNPLISDGVYYDNKTSMNIQIRL
ncbi:hypothetical protein FDP41_002778 [Naegleria fowleri]|uniref:Cystinosin n=1 Tax=Naegleria fowleri TaxID=5763 RepID=A0A6A5BJX7_NAEFO|nr:uncharacterized protein FDP41_002778 [Naegleria fowleri]KAF0978263.1 hypothetical protein FDP41_002778 [Naegleria fowleri]